VASWEQWRFEVVDLDGKRVDKVLASRIEGAAGPVDADAGERASDDAEARAHDRTASPRDAGAASSASP
jgi:putative hemolysin